MFVIRFSEEWSGIHPSEFFDDKESALARLDVIYGAVKDEFHYQIQLYELVPATR